MFRLALAPQIWQTQLRGLAAPGHVGVAPLNRNQLPATTEFVARSLEIRAGGATGTDFGSLDELLLVRLADAVAVADTVEMITRFSPRPDQVVVGLAMGHGRAAGCWTASVWEHGRFLRVRELRLVGPQMRRMTIDEQRPEQPLGERWSRTRGALGEEVWRKVRDSRVAIIGASRNGSITAVSLAMLGVRTIVLIDPDRDELHGLDATLGAVPAGLGNPKALNRSKALLRIRPNDLEVHPLVLPFPHPKAEEALRDCDLICTCVDRDTARLAAAEFANRWCKVHLDIGTGVFHAEADRVAGADVRLLLPGQACVLCFGGVRNLQEARYEVVGRPEALRRGPRREWSEERACSLVTLNSIATNFGVQLFLDLLAGRVLESRWCRLELGNDGRVNVTYPSIPDAPCGTCQRARGHLGPLR